eukprot:m.156222 g.156222  ORF g.156222 m.156222 type:complete len:58 (-) comp24683_c1_seq1:51-224(-)
MTGKVLSYFLHHQPQLLPSTVVVFGPSVTKGENFVLCLSVSALSASVCVYLSVSFSV